MNESQEDTERNNVWELRKGIQDLKTQDGVKEVLTHALSVWYEFFTVNYLADMIFKEANEKKMNEEDLDTFIHESIDGSAEVIYTYQAKLVAACSNNADEAKEQGVDLAYDDASFDSARAYWALMADVMERLNYLGLNVSDPTYGETE
jgi:hypothetical protein